MTIFVGFYQSFQYFNDNAIVMIDKVPQHVSISGVFTRTLGELGKVPNQKKYGPVLLETTIKEEWIDFNGHMNMAYYVLLFDQAMTNFLDSLDLGLNYVRENGKSLFALENHVTYQHELKQGDPVRVHFQLLDVDSKFIHYFMRLFHKDASMTSATMEQISLHVNMKTRIPCRFNDPEMTVLLETFEQHKTLEKPREMGRSIAIRRHQPTPKE